MKKFHIIIKDNKTGEILHDVDTDAIIAAVHEEGKTAGIALTACDGKALLEALEAVKNVRKEIISSNPLLSLLEMIENVTENN